MYSTSPLPLQNYIFVLFARNVKDISFYSSFETFHMPDSVDSLFVLLFVLS
jgi:hypothetical protein